MGQNLKISLNNKWRYCYATKSEDYSDVTVDDSNWDSITFTDIPIEEMSPHDVIWLRKRFDLTPAEACVRYFLRCEGRAYPMTIYLRGQAIAQYDKEAYLDVDVTDYVSLDDNVLVLMIRFDGQTVDLQQTELHLQPIFCDDLN
jgi:hypothetical protein